MVKRLDPHKFMENIERMQMANIRDSAQLKQVRVSKVVGDKVYIIRNESPGKKADARGYSRLSGPPISAGDVVVTAPIDGTEVVIGKLGGTYSPTITMPIIHAAQTGAYIFTSGNTATNVNTDERSANDNPNRYENMINYTQPLGSISKTFNGIFGFRARVTGSALSPTPNISFRVLLTDDNRSVASAHQNIGISTAYTGYSMSYGPVSERFEGSLNIKLQFGFYATMSGTDPAIEVQDVSMFFILEP